MKNNAMLWVWILTVFCASSYSFTSTGPIRSLQFRQVIENGLSQRSPLCMLQDQQGFIWVGTEVGLNRFDGYEYIVYRHDIDNPNSLSSSNVLALEQTNNGFIWVGTLLGLNRFDPATATFHRYDDSSIGPHFLGPEPIQTLKQDRHGSLWVGTSRGVFRYRPKADNFEKVGGQTLAHVGVHGIYHDTSGFVWLATTKGLVRLNPTNGDVVPFSLAHHTANKEPRVFSVAQDQRNRLWVVTENGLSRLENDKETFVHFPFVLFSKSSQKAPVVSTVSRDRQGCFWIGGRSGELLFFDTTEEEYRPVISSGDYAWEGRVISVLFEDLQGAMWLGAAEAGLSYYNPKRLHFDHLQHHPNEPSSIWHSSVRTIVEDESGIVWIGSNKGLNRYDPKQDSMSRIHLKPSDSEGTRIQKIHPNGDGTLWLGGNDILWHYDTRSDRVLKRYEPPELDGKQIYPIRRFPRTNTLVIGSNSGIYAFDENKGTSDDFLGDQPESNADAWFYTMHQDHQDADIMWLSRLGLGLIRFNWKTKQWLPFQAVDAQGIGCSTVLGIHQEGETMWFSTARGLCRYRPNDPYMKRWEKGHGLPDNTLYDVLPDRAGRFWVTTNRGLSVFHPEQMDFYNFEVRDGLQDNEFNGHAALVTRSGTMYCGGINGISVFKPHQLRTYSSVGSVALIDLRINNQPVSSLEEDSPLEKEISYASQLSLSPQHRMFSLGFSALDYNSPWRTGYAYKLEGFNNDWIRTTAENRRATYTNLAPGKYRFLAKRTDRLNAQETSIEIFILAPLWLRWWAKLLYVLAAMGLVGWYLRHQAKSLEHQRQITEQQKQLAQNARDMAKKDRATLESLRELDALKDAFLANTSHELRTPLHGIIGLVEGIMEGPQNSRDPSVNQSLNMIAISARRLSSLVNDILDYSQLKQNALEARMETLSLYEAAEMVLTISRPMADTKALSLYNDVPKALAPVLADSNRLQQILHNLVGNAIKFTEQGEVRVRATLIDGRVQVTVSDTGPGIAPQEQERIFIGFHQADGSTGRSHGGTGLGLTITRELVRLHGSDIHVQSEPGQGAHFTFSLAQSEEAPNLILNDQVSTSQIIKMPERNTFPSSYAPKASRILIVDDEAVNRRVLENYLSSCGYQSDQASGGKQALQMLENPYDLVLLDLMMPGISGYEICRMLRQKKQPHELPVLFLTARNQVTDLAEAFAVGANDFITKPVSRAELLARVETHLSLLDANKHLEQLVEKRTRTLITQQSMVTIGMLTSGIAHEFNNPNNFILGGAQNLVQIHRETLDELKKIQHQIEPVTFNLMHENFLAAIEQLDMIQKYANKIDDVVCHMESFGSSNQERTQIVDLRDCIQRALWFIRARFLDLNIQYQPNGPVYIKCRPGPLSQALFNLLLNAQEAMSNKSYLGPEDCIGLFVSTQGGLRISITDRGAGFHKDQLEHIFDPFNTRKLEEPHKGFGLYHAWQIIEEHGGHIEVESHLGQGSSFTICLPISLVTQPEDQQEVC